MALTTVKAISASSVLNSIGINTHIDFNNYGYQNLSVTEAAINYLGIKNLRDSADNPNTLGVNGTWQQVANATGAKFDDYMTEGSPTSDQTDLSYISQLASQGILNFVEGGDENDNSYATSSGNSIAWTASFQQQVYATAHALGLPVINMSFGSGWTATNNWHGDYDKVGDLSAYADYANAHTYPMAGSTTGSTIQTLNSDALLAASSRPVITTEIGWDTSTFSQYDQARFTLDAVFDGIKDGDTKMYFYALFDDGSGNFGLMNQDGTAKQAGTALHDLTTILADTTASTTGSLTYGLTGTTANDQSLLMEKSNGTFELVLWNETDAAHNVTLTLGSAAQTVKVYDPMTGTTAIATYSTATSVTIDVPTYPVIVEITPSSASSTTTSTGSGSATASSGSSSGTTGTTTTGTTSSSSAASTTPDPVVTVPGVQTMTAGSTLALTGISISDPWAATVGGTLALNITTTTGTVSGKDASGKLLSGSGTSGIHVSGTLAQINAELGTLTFSDATAGTAQVNVDVWDQAGVETTKAIGVTVNGTSSNGASSTASTGSTSSTSTSSSSSLATASGTTSTTASAPNPVVTVPGAQTVTAGAGLAFSGISISDPWAAAAGGTLALNVTTTAGTVSAKDASGNLVSGSGTSGIHVSGTLAQINAELATLTFADATTGNAQVTVDVWDQAGVEGTKTIGVTVNPPPSTVVTVPATVTATTASAVALTGVSVADPWAATAGGTLALNVATSAGTVSGKDGSGNLLSGSGTAGIHVSGALAQINADLATLTFSDAKTGSAQVTVDVWDQAGVEATKTIGITVNAASTAISASTAMTATTANSVAPAASTPSPTSSVSNPVVNQTYTVNSGQSFHLTGGTNTIYGLGNGDTVRVDSGTNTIFANGSGDTLAGGSGSDVIQAFSGGNTIKAGSGSENIRFAGSNNTIYAGSGSDTIADSGTNNRIVLAKAGSGVADLYGYVLSNGDTLDLRSLLASTSWNGSTSTLSNYIQLGLSGSDATISINTTGQAGSASHHVATLHGSGAVTLSTLLAHSLV